MEEEAKWKGEWGRKKRRKEGDRKEKEDIGNEEL